MNLKAGRRAAGAVAFSMMLLACNPASEDKQTGSQPSEAPAKAAPPAEAVLPTAGTMLIEASEGRYRVLANEVPRIEFLNNLKTQVGFALQLGEITEEQKAAPVSLIAVDATLSEVLLEALDGVPFEIQYAVDATEGGHLLAELRLAGGDEPDPRADRRRAALQRNRHGKEGGPPRMRGQRRDPAERKAKLPSPEERARLEAERALEAPALLRSDDPADRARGAGGIELDPDGIGMLSDLITEDPDPAVRIAAAERLGDGDTIGAVKALLSALKDPNSEVVIEALDALEFVDDPAIASEVEFLFDHPDPAVVEKAKHTHDFVQ